VVSGSARSTASNAPPARTQVLRIRSAVVGAGQWARVIVDRPNK
jgi:hypothetical protein